MAMWRRGPWLTASASAVAALLVAPRAACANPGRWIIEPSEAHDAIRLIAYGGYPPASVAIDAQDAAVAALAARIPSSAMKHVLDRFGYAFVDLFVPLLQDFDYARPRTVADLRAAVRTVAPRAEKWFAQSAGDLERIVDALIAAGFSDYWREHHLPRAAAGAARLRLALGNTDPFTAASGVLGTPAGEDATLLVQGYAKRDWYWLEGRRFYVHADRSLTRCYNTSRTA